MNMSFSNTLLDYKMEFFSTKGISPEERVEAVLNRCKEESELLKKKDYNYFDLVVVYDYEVQQGLDGVLIKWFVYKQ